MSSIPSQAGHRLPPGRRFGFIAPIAFALVAADFPLTRQIVSAMSIGSDTNWTVEQLMVSGGIVALSLFFKLLTDPFTQPRYLMGAGWRVALQIVSGILFVGIMAGVVSMLIWRDFAIRRS